MLELILASDPSLPPVYSLPTQYEPPVHFLPFGASMPSLSASCMYIDPVFSVHSYTSRHNTDDLAPYCLYSRVSHPCLLTSSRAFRRFFSSTNKTGKLILTTTNFYIIFSVTKG